MILLQFNPVHGLYHGDLFFVTLVFINDILYNGIMLLVRDMNMSEQRTLTWQKRASEFKTFDVPEFRLFSAKSTIKIIVFFGLNDEANFGRVTKVANYDEADLINK